MKQLLFLYSLIYIFISLFLWHATPPAGHYDVDSYGYDSIAEYFAQTGDLTDPHHPESAPVQPVGYPFIVGLFFKIFGHDVRPILITQIFLMCLALAFIMVIARRIEGERLAYVAGLFFLLTPGFYIYSQLLLAEVFLLVLILFLFERYLAFLQTGSINALFMAGLCAGISMLIKPVVMLFVLFVSILAWYAMQTKTPVKRQALLCSMLFAGSFAFPVALYTARNYVRYGYASFAPMMPLNMYQIFLAKVMSALAHKDPQEFIEGELRFRGTHSFDAVGWDHARDLFMQHVKKHPLLCIQIWCVNVIKTWCGLYVTQLKKMLEPDGSLVGHSYFLQSGNALQKIDAYISGGTSFGLIILLGWYECIWSILRLLLACYGMCMLFKKDKLLGWFFLSAGVGLSVPTGIDGCCRYRIIFEAVLILLSAIAFLRIYVRCFYTKEGARVWFFPVKKYLPGTWR